jgi:hypothetical protein
MVELNDGEEPGNETQHAQDSANDCLRHFLRGLAMFVYASQSVLVQRFTLGATLDACKGHMRQMHVVCTSNKAHKVVFGIQRPALWHALCLCVGEQSLQQRQLCSLYSKCRPHTFGRMWPLHALLVAPGVSQFFVISHFCFVSRLLSEDSQIKLDIIQGQG